MSLYLSIRTYPSSRVASLVRSQRVASLRRQIPASGQHTFHFSYQPLYVPWMPEHIQNMLLAWYVATTFLHHSDQACSGIGRARDGPKGSFLLIGLIVQVAHPQLYVYRRYPWFRAWITTLTSCVTPSYWLCSMVSFHVTVSSLLISHFPPHMIVTITDYLIIYGSVFLAFRAARARPCIPLHPSESRLASLCPPTHMHMSILGNLPGHKWTGKYPVDPWVSCVLSCFFVC